MSASIVIGSIFLSSDELFGMEKLAVSSSSDLIDDSGFQVNKNSSRYVFTSSSFGKECGEGIVSAHHLIGWHLTVRLDAMLQAVEFPTGITDLAAGLANMNGDTFTLEEKEEF